ncbi:MAG TPA: UDP-N-acetylmuramoyl-tripeptide--D-alanyl-D-alanine ligase [Candidatus Eremiobacteraceae bacterium]|nr:UDP-N-acetylmuramoyl-tripeptide--D-alanyl-D-alanine ligase [Candidatus Eremiobacteraceae bacterium]
MSRLTLSRFLEASGGRLAGTARLEADTPFVPSTDSRTLRPGETFVALRGESFDGHHYIGAARAAGAAALVVDRLEAVPAGCDVVVVAVDDAKAAYLRGAAAARRMAARTLVVAITGSVGKTTTKAFAAQLIGRFRRVIATPQNENNELGVAKLCYAIGDGVDVAIAEFGARHPGEITQLVEIAAPDVGVLVNVGEAHLEFFTSREELARTKFAIFGAGARAVCNAADEWTRRLAIETGIAERALWVRLCGEPDMPGLTLEAGEPRDGRVPLSLGASHAFAAWHLIGEHHLRDALLAAAAGLQCGLRFEEAIDGFGDLRLPPGRFEQHALPSGAIAVYDAYNASPTSMRHALRAFASLPAQRHIAVLGSMAELGESAPTGHARTGAAAAQNGMDALYCGGDHAQAIALGALEAGMAPTAVHTYVTNAEIAQTLRAQLRERDAVLLKGSRIQRMEEILDVLLAPESGTSAAPKAETSEAARAAEAESGREIVPKLSGVLGAGAADVPLWHAKTFDVRAPELPARIVALPVRTPLVKPGDDLAALVAQCVRGIADGDDVACISETAVAIAQGRSIPAESIRPGRLARMLADRAGSYATMNQPESMQLVIEHVGAAKVVAAAVAGAAGRLVGRRGDFYRILGPAVAEIDGYTGTMPPYERHIVLGPQDPQAVAEQIAPACGAHVAIVDANDLHKVEVLGASAAVNRDAVRACLRDNPHGNSDQQTPIVVLKYRPTPSSPAASPLLL